MMRKTKGTGVDRDESGGDGRGKGGRRGVMGSGEK